MDKLNPHPVISEPFGEGNGLAHCATLGVVVVSTFDGTLHVVKTPVVGTESTMERLYTLGGPSSEPPMKFNFYEGNESGRVAFTGPPHRRRLLVTENATSLVHVIDVVGKVHRGYLARPGIIRNPIGVAATNSLVAISAWGSHCTGPQVVHLLEGDGNKWTQLRIIGNHDGPEYLRAPVGLRFTRDNTELVIAEWGKDRVSAFHVGDGSFARYLIPEVKDPEDLEEYDGGWIVASWCSNNIHFFGGSRGDILAAGGKLKWCYRRPVALASVPGVGIMIRNGRDNGNVDVFATYDAIAMAGMSANRVEWMVAVARCALARGRVAGGSARKSRKMARRAGAVS